MKGSEEVNERKRPDRLTQGNSREIYQILVVISYKIMDIGYDSGLFARFESRVLEDINLGHERVIINS